MNNCLFTGRLTRDLDLKETEQGTKYVQFELAVTRMVETKAGNKHKEIVFPEFEMWGTAAECLVENARKGTRLFLETSLKQNMIQKDNEKVNFVETDSGRIKSYKFRVNNFEILDKWKTAEVVDAQSYGAE